MMNKYVVKKDFFHSLFDYEKDNVLFFFLNIERETYGISKSYTFKKH